MVKYVRDFIVLSTNKSIIYTKLVCITILTKIPDSDNIINKSILSCTNPIQRNRGDGAKHVYFLFSSGPK